jgi:hypothetical protein
VDLGRTFSEAWWYSQSRLNLTNKEFKDSLWSTNMKARFGLSDKASDDSDKGANSEMAQVMRSLTPLLAKLPVVTSIKKAGTDAA